MIYKQYGNTNMAVSAVGFGTMRYDMDDVKVGNYDNIAEILHYAHAKGINYFDTAPLYCEDKSEEITGYALSQLQRDSYYLTSKTNFNTLKNDTSRDSFRRRLELSLERLKTDYIDFYHMWCIIDAKSYEKHMDALYGYFEEAKSEGLIRNIVFSSHMQGEDLKKVTNDRKYKGILLGYNALNYKFRQEGVVSAHEAGMGVVVMNPLGGGLIPQNPDKFAYLTEGTKYTVAQAALRFVVAQKEVSVALAGFTKKSHVDDALAAIENLKIKTSKEIISDMSSKSVVLNDLCTGCGYCKYCPEEIDIPKYMDSYNQNILGGDMAGRLKGHWGITQSMASKCISCYKCESLCTQHLPIVERLKEIANIDL